MVIKDRFTMQITGWHMISSVMDSISTWMQLITSTK